MTTDSSKRLKVVIFEDDTDKEILIERILVGMCGVEEGDITHISQKDKEKILENIQTVIDLGMVPIVILDEAGGFGSEVLKEILTKFPDQKGLIMGCSVSVKEQEYSWGKVREGIQTQWGIDSLDISENIEGPKVIIDQFRESIQIHDYPEESEEKLI